MVSRSFSRFLDKPRPRQGLTIWHLQRKLKRLDARIAKPNAKASDYMQRERVLAQLKDAQKFRG